MTAAIDEVRAHHSAGRLQEAETIYHRVLAAEPDNPDALHLLGVIAHEMGKNELAMDSALRSGARDVPVGDGQLGGACVR